MSSNIGKKYEKMLEQIPKKRANETFAKHLADAPMGSINAYWQNYHAPSNLNSTKTTIFSNRFFS